MKDIPNRDNITNAQLTSLDSVCALGVPCPLPGNLSPAQYSPQGTKSPAQLRTEFSSAPTQSLAPLLSADTDQVTLLPPPPPPPAGSSQHAVCPALAADACIPNNRTMEK